VKKKAIPWTDELRQAFYAAQEWIRQHYRPLLIPNTSAPYRLYCDASRSGMGAALLQLCPATQRWEPVEFYSKQWQCPKAYGVRELELKALHDAVRHWRHLLRYGQHVQVYSDHQSLSYKIDPVSNTSCAPVDGWVAFLSRYKMTVTYVKGENNTVADYLSRSAALSATVNLLCHEGGGGKRMCQHRHKSPCQASPRDSINDVGALVRESNETERAVCIFSLSLSHLGVVG
jgi:hypothetical protein